MTTLRVSLPIKAALCVALAVALSLTSFAPAAEGAKGFKRLGTDLVGDGPPGFDLTYLDVGRRGSDLEIRIGMDEIVPVYPAPDPFGVEWIFDVKGKTFLAEGYVQRGQPEFTLFQITGDSFTVVSDLEGSFDINGGYVMIRVPLKLIGAKRGTLISGTGKKGTEDVDWHIHHATTTYTDFLATTKDYRVK